MATPQTYTPTSNPQATFGEQSSSVLGLQKMLNEKYGANLALDSKFGPLTQAAYDKYIKSATPTTDFKPRVTPTTTPGTPPIPEGGTPASFDTAQDKTYKSLLDRSSGLIGSITQKYKDELRTSDAAANARVNAGGLGGSTAGGRIVSEAEQPILDAREADLQQVYSNIEQLSHEYTKENLANAKDAVATMAKNHLDWQNYKQTNPENYKALVDSLGGDPNYADALFATSVPPDVVDQTWNTSDGSGGTTVNQLSHDPLTNKPIMHSFDIPGISIPKNWAQVKVGTGVMLYDPANPAENYIMNSDGLGGFSISKDGKVISSIGGGGSTAPAAPQVASLIDPSFTDTSIGLSDAIDKYGIGAVINGITQNEGGSLKGVENNPGNIKFAGLPGQTDSGVKAADGGTFASYATKQDGEMGIYDLIQKGIASGKSFEDFVNAYTGTGTSGQPATGIAAIGDAIIAGKQPPDLKGFYSKGAAIKAYLAEKGFDLTKATEDWTATQKYIATLNGSQQVRLRQAVNFAYDSLPIIDNLSTEWSSVAKDARGNLVPLNSLNLKSAINGLYGADAASVATRLESQISDLTSELGTVYKGGNSSTDDSLALAAKNLNASWSEKTLKDSIGLVKQNLAIRKASISSAGIAGVGGDNDYSQDTTVNTDVVSAATGATGTLDNGTAVTKADDGNWYDSSGNVYDSDGNPI